MYTCVYIYNTAKFLYKPPYNFHISCVVYLHIAVSDFFDNNSSIYHNLYTIYHTC